MQKLPQNELTELINIAETELRKSGTIVEAVNKIVNLAFNRGFRVDRKEVRSQLIDRMADEVVKDLKKELCQ